MLAPSTPPGPAPGPLRSALGRSGLLGPLRAARERLAYWRWAAAGHPAPAPHLAKRRRVLGLARRYECSVFVETGTFQGDMVQAVLRDFERIYSIELGEDLWRNARERFAAEPRVTLLQGDSARVLGEILAVVDRPCLFWLDGHYSAGITARGDRDTPVAEELARIGAHFLCGRHVILIDDAREFTGKGDYPTLEWIQEWARGAGYSGAKVVDDMITITPGQVRSDRQSQTISHAPASVNPWTDVMSFTRASQCEYADGCHEFHTRQPE